MKHSANLVWLISQQENNVIWIEKRKLCELGLKWIIHKDFDPVWDIQQVWVGWFLNGKTMLSGWRGELCELAGFRQETVFTREISSMGVWFCEYLVDLSVKDVWLIYLASFWQETFLSQIGIKSEQKTSFTIIWIL